MANGTLLYNTGTLGVTNGQVNFTIAGAAGIKDALPYGAVIRIRGDNRDYEATITSDTAGAFNEAYAGTTNAAAPYDAIKINSIAFAATTLANVATTYSGVAKLTAGDQYFNFNRNATANRAGMVLQTAGADKFRVGMMANDNFEVQRWDSGLASWVAGLSLSAAGVLTAASLAVAGAIIGSNAGFWFSGTNPFAQSDGSLNSLFASNGNQTITLGLSTNVYKNTNHLFQNIGGSTTYGSFSPTAFAVNYTTASNSTVTGALQVAGGVGIVGNLNVGGAASALSYTIGSNGSLVPGTIFSNANFGMLFTSLLVSPGNSMFAWFNTTASTMYASITPTGDFKIWNATASSTPATGALLVVGGAGIGGALNVGGGGSLANTANPRVRIVNTSGAASTLIFGADSGAAWLGSETSSSLYFVTNNTQRLILQPTGEVALTSTLASNSTVTGALQVAGGVGIVGNLNVGGTLSISSAATPAPVPLIASRAQGNAIKFGHSNTAYYGTLGAQSGGGTPFIALFAEHSPTLGNTMKNGGVTRGMYMQWDGTNYKFFMNGDATAEAVFSNVITPLTVGLSGVTATSLAVSSNNLYGSSTAKMMIGFAGGGTEYGLTLRPGVDNTTAIQFFSATSNPIGSISITATATTYNTSSDKRLKEDLRTFNKSGEIIDALEIWDFRWKATNERGVGVMAQDALKVFPDAIHVPHKEEEFLGADYSKYVPVLLEETKRLRSRVKELEQRLAA